MALGILTKLGFCKTRPNQTGKKPQQLALDIKSLVERLDKQFNLGLEANCNMGMRDQLSVNIALAVRLRSQALKLLNKKGPLSVKEVNRFLKRVGFMIQKVDGFYKLHPQPGLVII